MIRMDSCRIEITETNRTGIQTIQERSQRLWLPEMLHQFTGHGFHHNQYNIGATLLHTICFWSMSVHSQRWDSYLSLTIEQSLRLSYGFLLIHQMQVFIFRTHIIHHTRQQIKSRTYSQLIQKSILTEICRTHFDRIITCTPPNSKDAKADQTSSDQNHNSSLPKWERSGNSKATTMEITRQTDKPYYEPGQEEQE